MSRRPQISRDFLLDVRRRRFAAGLAEVSSDLPLCEITVDLICRAAEGSRASFYQCFDSSADCLRFGVAEAYERLFEPVGEPAEGEAWLAGCHCAIEGLYANVLAEPLAARLFLLHSSRHGAPGAVDLESGVARLKRLLAGGRAAPGARPDVPALAEEFWARAILDLAAGAIRREEPEALAARAAPLTILLGASFLGAEALGQRSLGLSRGA